MTNEAWVKGMATLAANLRDRDLTAEMVTLRGDSYRRRLDYLADDHWLYVVDQVVDRYDWFPTIHELLEVADEVGRRVTALVPAKSEAEREREREEAKATYRRVREHLVAVGLADPLSLAPASACMNDAEWERRKREQLNRLSNSERRSNGDERRDGNGSQSEADATGNRGEGRDNGREGSARRPPSA